MTDAVLPLTTAQVAGIKYYALPFTSARDFVEFFDPALRSGQRKLHPWQSETLDFLSDTESLKLGKRPRFSLSERLKFLLCAANGSGKDAYVIAGFVCFVLCCWPRYKQVITSSSYLQLDTQTRVYIKLLSEQVNQYLRANGIMDEDAIDIKKETFVSTIFRKEDGTRYSLTGGEVITFVTDEGGRAEGHHPWPDALPGEGVIIIINEGKSVSDEIYEHLRKCTFNYWIEVSSAGAASHHFYDALSQADDWKVGFRPGHYLKRTVTSYDCPHKALSEIEADKREYGETSAFFRNTHLSQSVSTGDSVVITKETLDKCLASAKDKVDIGLPRRAGLDLAGGGDECALYVFDNNVCIAHETWRSRDTEVTVELLCGSKDESGLFTKYALEPENIYGDDNGLGQPIIDGMARIARKDGKKWEIVRVRNQSKAFDTTKYRNRGIELWVRFARLVEEQIVILPKSDERLHKELANRHYDTEEVQGKRKLLSKEEEKSQGNPSPNRADAVVLAFTGLTITDFQDGKRTLVKSAGPPTIGSVVDLMPNRGRYRLDMAAQESAEPTKRDGFHFSNPINLQQSIYD